MPPLFLPPGTKVKIVKIYQYPWIEITWTWIPSGSYDVSGKAIPPTPRIEKCLFNLDYAVTISPVEDAQ